MSLTNSAKEKLFNGTFDANIIPWTDHSTVGGIAWESTGGGKIKGTAPSPGAAIGQYAMVQAQPATYPELGNLAPNVECELSFDITDDTSAAISVIVGTTPGGTEIYDSGNIGIGSYSTTFTTSATSIYIRFIIGSGGIASGALDNFSLKQKTGVGQYTVIN